MGMHGDANSYFLMSTIRQAARTDPQRQRLMRNMNEQIHIPVDTMNKEIRFVLLNLLREVLL